MEVRGPDHSQKSLQLQLALCILGFLTTELTLEQHGFELCGSIELWPIEKTLYKWIHAVRTCVVQWSIVYMYLDHRLLTETHKTRRISEFRYFW